MEDKVLETVINGINYTFEKDMLVKPLPAIMIEKEFTEQIPTGKTDKEGFNEYTTKTHTKKVESDFAQTRLNCLQLFCLQIYNKYDLQFQFVLSYHQSQVIAQGFLLYCLLASSKYFFFSLILKR